jgi:hypothetical protein
MRTLRVLVAWVLTVGLSTSALAGDLQSSVAQAARDAAQVQQSERTPIAKGYLIPGAALFIGGMAMAFYGFLHTKGGDFVSGQVSKESNTELGGAGLAVAGLGGALLFAGARRSKASASVALGPHRVTVSKRISW